jgi:hypothetical protein
MKKTVIIIAALVALLAKVLVAYRFGYSTGHKRTLGLSQGTFSLTLAAIQALSSNDVPAAIEYLDGQCYAHASFLLAHPHWREGVCVKTFMPELIEYRRKHAWVESEWTPMERTLEDLLVKHGWKSEHHPAPYPEPLTVQER